MSNSASGPSGAAPSFFQKVEGALHTGVTAVEHALGIAKTEATADAPAIKTAAGAVVEAATTVVDNAKAAVAAPAVAAPAATPAS